MKKLNVSQMENLQGGTNRQCLVDGFLTVGSIAIGGITGGIWGAVGGALVGFGMANSNNCLNN